MPPPTPAPILHLPPTPSHGPISLTPWHPVLAPSLAASANNITIWRSLRDSLPHPYTLSDAEWWIDRCQDPAHWAPVLTYDENGVETIAEKVPCNFAIVTPNPETGEDSTIGSIGLVPGTDVARRSAELGYWLGEGYWGRGIMREVVKGFIEWTWERFPGLVRVHAEVFAGNERSVGVLREAGFVFEGRRRGAVWKEGRVRDAEEWAVVREGVAEGIS
jgi:ribosomal-protein-alanine N-acetyltransferase